MRLRSLHNMYIAKKPRGGKQDKAAASAHGSVMEEGDEPKTARGPRGRRIPCGLCFREFPQSGLPGSCLKRTAERLRRQMPQPPATRPPEEPMSARLGENDSAFEFELPLCVPCWQF